MSKKIRERLGDRQTLDLEDLYARFNLPARIGPNALQDCLRAFEEECHVPMGLLRPNDPIKKFIEPPRSKNPLVSIYWWFYFQDKESELSYRLKQARERRGVDPIPSTPPSTLRDYVLMWFAAETDSS